jgi:CubicO group peptidase (beta-lactamase class C family)
MLGEAVQLHAGRSLRDLALARSGLRFAPLPGPAVATELCRWRARLIDGEVHDENAAAMGGVAGHAGAFGTLDLVVAAAQSWLAERVISPRLHAQARRCWSMGRDGYRYGLGWWLDRRPGLGGPAAGPDGYGCTGFVGNRIWLEPGSGYGVCVLSNRIHPDRTDPAPFLAWCDGLFALVSEALQ